MPSSKEYNESSVLLLEPLSTKPSSSSLSKKKAAKMNTNNPRASYLGGSPCYFPLDPKQKDDPSSCPKCDICKQTMFLILQMYAPLNLEEDEAGEHDLDRTMLVFGCNRASCIQQAFQQGPKNQQSACPTTTTTTTTTSSSMASGSAGNKEGHGKGSMLYKTYRFLLGGQGVIRCFRTQQPTTAAAATNMQLSSQNDNPYQQQHGNNNINNKKNNDQDKEDCEKGRKDCNSLGSWGDDTRTSWFDEDGDANTDSDWGFQPNRNKCTHSEASTDIMEDIEAMVAAMETNNQQFKKEQKQQNHKCKTRTKRNHKGEPETNSNKSTFPRFDLDFYDEPCAGFEQGDSDDEDVGSNNIHDDAVQSLLTKYLEQEEDSDIVAVIRGCGGGGGIRGGNGDNTRVVGNESVEKYEKLPPEDRAFLTFTARVKLAPKQSVRYEYGGTPIWSIPTPTTNVTSSSKRRGKRPQQVSSFPSVPPCPCGAKREFEFQLMPSILHVLNVDKYATIGNRIDLPTSRNEKDEILGTFSSGGMNWGTIAVYSCSVSCGEFREEYVVVQESVDGDPKRMDMKVISNKNGNGNKDLDSDINY